SRLDVEMVELAWPAGSKAPLERIDQAGGQAADRFDQLVVHDEWIGRQLAVLLGDVDVGRNRDDAARIDGFDDVVDGPYRARHAVRRQVLRRRRPRAKAVREIGGV